jgi:predicted component of type VI protein secretion system
MWARVKGSLIDVIDSFDSSTAVRTAVWLYSCMQHAGGSAGLHNGPGNMSECCHPPQRAVRVLPPSA